MPAVTFGAAGEAPAGSIAHVRRELDHARQAGAVCGIVVGQEFTRVTPEKLTFWWAGRAAFWRAAEELADELAEENGGYAQFRGVSVNDLSAYQAASA